MQFHTFDLSPFPSLLLDSKPRAQVEGGPLAGLFAATTLRAVGWDVPANPLLGVDSDDRIHQDIQDRVISRTFMPQTQTSWNQRHKTWKATLSDGTGRSGGGERRPLAAGNATSAWGVSIGNRIMGIA